MDELTVKEAIAKAAALCSRKEYCCSEIRTKLERWGLSETEEVITYLLEEKYINEDRFTRFFVRDKFRFNKWGRIKIRYALKLKKIPGHIVECALEQEIDPGIYVETLSTLIASQSKRVKGKSDFEIKGKLYRFAYGRGFEPELIQQLLD